MMKLIILLCSILAITFAAVARGPLHPKPEKYKHLKGCYIRQLDRVIPLGKMVADTRKCMGYECGTDFLYYSTCGATVVDQSCKVVRDSSKPYPGCCPEAIC